MSEKLTRIDPEGCGCTDCGSGYSMPINYCSQKELKKLKKGKLDNASGCKIITKYTYE